MNKLKVLNILKTVQRSSQNMLLFSSSKSYQNRQCANLERVHLRSFQPVQSPSDGHQRPNTKRIKALQITTGTECTFVQTCATCASRSALCFQCERFQSFSPTGACDATGQLTLSVACDFSVQAAPPFQSLRLAKYFKQFVFFISISHLFS